MSKRSIIIVAAIAVAALSFGWIYTVSSGNNQSLKGQIVFMDNFKVFEGFAMKKEYDKQLEKEIYLERTRIDSIAAEMEGLSKSGQTEKFNSKQQEFMYVKKQFDEKFQKLSQEYTSQVYERLNIYIRDFGKSHEYRLILGSAGDGNVMYAEKKADITDELIDYINKQYLDN